MTNKSRDQLTETTDEGKIELAEEELNRVTGGTKGEPAKYLEIKLTDVLISSYQTGGSKD